MTAPTMQPQSPGPLRRIHERARNEFWRSLDWLRRCLERENLLAGLKTFAWLAPLTLLIWIYAEREQVEDRENQTIPIEVRSNDPNRYVELRMDRPEDKNVVATLSGPRSRLDEARMDIEPRPGKPSSVAITVPEGYSPGTVHEMDTAQLLGASPIFKQLTVKSVRPARIKVFVDTYEVREFDVQVPASAASVVTNAVFEPRKVKVHAPASAFAEAGKNARLTVEADLDTAGVLSTLGAHTDTPVHVYIPGLTSDRVAFDPPTVKATLEVRESGKIGVIPSMPIYVTAPHLLLKAFTVECPDTIPNVKVIGAADKIADLERADSPYKPWAVLTVTADDRPPNGPKGPHPLKFEGLPDGVHVTDDAPLEFKIVPKTADQ